MTDTVPPLAPWSLDMLLSRVAHEWRTRRRIFDLPAGKFHRREDGPDISLDLGGARIATPLGPAAGPHTQMAQNIVLAWLAGARFFELKTVQVLDDLEIGRPCIDVETFGTNVEWSQELALDDSLEQYATALMMLEILRRWEPLREILGDPGDHVFELSAGYDLEGLRSQKVARFFDRAADLAPVIDKLRPLIPEPFAGLRDLEFPTRLATGVTVSTFHGCPPAEIAAMARQLMQRHGLDVTVKLNPTLLGLERTREVLHDVLGLRDVVLVPEAFAEDLQWDDALGLIGELRRDAEVLGRRFGIKLTNTLVVGNDKGALPGERMYLSGEPLHALAVNLLAELDAALPGVLALDPAAGGDVAVAFSAGVGRGNVAETVGLGLAPVTVCTDLLRPGGYGRMTAMLRDLRRAMSDAGCADIPAWRARRREEAVASGARDAVEAHARDVVSAEGSAAYAKDALKPPRRIDAELERWDCSSCNNCVTVCPNDAMIRLASPPGEGRLGKKWQFLCLADLCNECGNCATFCPETGEPFRIKPRLHLRSEKYREGEPGACRVRAAGSELVVEGGPDADLVGAVIAGPEGLPLPPEALESE